MEAQTFNHSAASNKAISGHRELDPPEMWFLRSSPSHVERHHFALHRREAASRCLSNSFHVPDVTAKRCINFASCLGNVDVRPETQHESTVVSSAFLVFCSVFLSKAECCACLPSHPNLGRICEQATVSPNVLLQERTLVYLIQHRHGFVCRKGLLGPRSIVIKPCEPLIHNFERIFFVDGMPESFHQTQHCLEQSCSVADRTSQQAALATISCRRPSSQSAAAALLDPANQLPWKTVRVFHSDIHGARTKHPLVSPSY